MQASLKTSSQSAAGFIKPEWPAPSSVHALVTTRLVPGISKAPYDQFNLGARCGDETNAVAHNREALAKYLPAPVQWLQQVHGVEVCRVNAQILTTEPKADAALIDNSQAVLAILTADCLPVLFCNRDGTEVAAAHAGWRGLAAGVLENTVQAMRSNPNQIIAWLGPAIAPSAYEVGEEVRSAFVDQSEVTAAAFVATRRGHWLCDLYALAQMRLRAVGVDQIYGGEFCTHTDSERFYSFRRNGQTGRMASLIWLD